MLEALNAGSGEDPICFLELKPCCHLNESGVIDIYLFPFCDIRAVELRMIEISGSTW